MTYTVLFFPDGRRYNRQLRSYDRRWLVDFMPNKALHTPGGPFTCALAALALQLDAHCFLLHTTSELTATVCARAWGLHWLRRGGRPYSRFGVDGCTAL